MEDTDTTTTIALTTMTTATNIYNNNDRCNNKHNHDDPKYPIIHATEFIAILNGSYHYQNDIHFMNSSLMKKNTKKKNIPMIVQTTNHLIYTLQRFVYTIQQDQIRSLFTNNGTNENNNNNNHHREIIMFHQVYNRSMDIVRMDDNTDTNAEDKEKHEEENEDNEMNEDDDDEEEDADDILPMKGQSNIDIDDDVKKPQRQRERPSKKRKITNDNNSSNTSSSSKNKNNESWKEDIASYNVPFVGTNINLSRSLSILNTNTNSNGRSNYHQHSIIHNHNNNMMWPNGVLYEYIQMSPMAIELLNYETSIVIIPPNYNCIHIIDHNSSINRTNIECNNQNIHSLLYKYLTSIQNRDTATTSTMNNNKQNNTKYQQQYYSILSKHICQLYIQTIAELISAMIPIEQLQQYYMNFYSITTNEENQNHDASSPRASTTLLSTITNINNLFTLDNITHQQLLCNVIQILKQDIQSYDWNMMKKTNTNNNSNKKVHSYNTNGILIVPIMTLLTRLSLLSLSITRRIIRLIEQTISFQQLRSLLSFPTIIFDTDNATAMTTTKDRHTIDSRTLIYVTTLHFISTLADSAINDSLILNSICNCNTNNTKSEQNQLKYTGSTSQPEQQQQKQQQQQKSYGLLYVALRHSLPNINSKNCNVLWKSRNENSKYIHVALVRFLRISRQILTNQNHRTSGGGIGNKRQNKNIRNNQHILYELFNSRELLQQLCNISIYWAPPLCNFNHVLSCTDQYDDGDDDEDQCKMNQQSTTPADGNDTKFRSHIGIEARRLLFFLLGDPMQSPLLQSIKSYHVGTKNVSDTTTTTSYNTSKNESTIQLIVRTIFHLLSQDSKTYGTHSSMVEIERFIIHITKTTPILLPTVLRLIHIDDENDRQKMITILSQLNFMSKLLRHGPRVIDCTSQYQNELHLTNETIIKDNDHDSASTIIYAIIPIILKKQKFMKLLNNTNILIQLESYKLLITILRRCQDYFNDLDRQQHNISMNKQLKSRISDTLQQMLPDMSTILLQYTKSTPISTIQTFDNKPKLMLMTWVCEIIRIYTSVFPNQMNLSLSTDLSKIFNIVSTQGFLSAPIFMQLNILSTIKDLIQSNKLVVTMQSNLFRVILEICISTRSERILKESRIICIQFICRLNSNVDDYETQYEASCWVDGITKGSLDEFCNVLKDLHSASFPISLELVKLWRKAKLPNPIPTRQLSAVLIRGWKYLNQASDEFVLLVVQVVTRCLLCSVNPIPLALFILEYTKETDATFSHPTHVNDLVEYTRTLVFFEKYSNVARTRLANRLFQSTFGGGFPFECLVKAPKVTTIKKTSREYSNEYYLAWTQQLAHVTIIRENSVDKHSQLDLLRRLVTISLVGSLHSPTKLDSVQRLFSRIYVDDDTHIKYLIHFINSIRTKVAISSRLIEMVKQNFESSILACSDSKGPSTYRQHSYYQLYLTGTFLPDQPMLLIVNKLLSQFGDDAIKYDERSLCRVTSSLLRILQLRMNWSIVGKATMAGHAMVLLKAWLNFNISKVRDTLSNEMIIEIENSLSSILLHGYSSLVLIAYNAMELVQRFVETKIAGNIGNRRPIGCLLTSMVSSDPLVFGPVFFQIHMAMKANKEYQRIFRNGTFDRSLVLILNCEGIAAEHSEEIHSIVGLYNDRMSNIVPDSTNQVDSLNDFLAIILKLLTLKDNDAVNNININSLAEVMVQNVPRLTDHKETRALSDVVGARSHETFVEVALCICKQFRGENDNINNLSLALLAYLCDTVSTTLRVQPERAELADNCTVYYITQHLNWVQELIMNDESFGYKLLQSDGKSSTKCLIKACLRYGMRVQVDGNHSVRVLCLQLILSFLTVVQREKISLDIIGNTSISCQVFTMVTTHSKFHELMSASGNSQVQLEVIRIILACVSDAEDIQFDRDICTILLACFDAGMTEKDCLLRCAIFEYSRLNSKAFPVLYCDELRWGEAAHRDVQRRSWDWLADSIDLSRVYETIDCFPINDTIIPQCPKDIKICSIGRGDDEICRKPRNASRRYSPGFLLPIILGALHNEAAILSSHTRQSNDVEHFHNKQSQNLAQTLSEKGALAISIGALASHCPSLRKVSVAILGLFIDALNRPEALSLSSWKQRPQIAMLLNSIQRSMVLRYCDYPSNHPGDIPELPGFSAVFLAKASIILAHPGDSLYPAINRAFLRSEDDAGGFQELTRLPAFIALFCSSADTTDQITSERKFALNLVKDGFTDPKNYKLLIQCHCPELILNSIESAMVRSSFGLDDELQLLFETLTTIITSGAERASSHLVYRLGLISWARAFILRNPIFPTAQDCVAFLNLLTELLNVARIPEMVMPIDDFIAETRGIANGVLSLTDPIGSGFAINKSTISPISVKVCDVLYLLSIAQHERLAKQRISLKSEQFHNHCRSDGIKVESAIRFVSTLHCDTQCHYIQRAIAAICVLPIEVATDDMSTLQELCDLILNTCCSVLQNLPPESKCAIIRRLCFLSRYLDSKVEGRKNLIRQILLWRSCFSKCPTLRPIWYDCLLSMTPLDNEETVDYMSCIQDETCWPLWILNNEKVK